MTSESGEKMTTENRSDTKKNELFKFIFQICTVLITAICLPLIAWTLLSTVNLKVDMATEKAIRETESRNLQKTVDDYKADLMKLIFTNDMENTQKHNEIVLSMEKQITSMKLDWEKRMGDYRAENDRRFTEIQKQLEQANLKLDKALDMLYASKTPK